MVSWCPPESPAAKSSNESVNTSSDRHVETALGEYRDLEFSDCKGCDNIEIK